MAPNADFPTFLQPPTASSSLHPAHAASILAASNHPTPGGDDDKLSDFVPGSADLSRVASRQESESGSGGGRKSSGLGREEADEEEEEVQSSDVEMEDADDDTTVRLSSRRPSLPAVRTDAICT